MPTLKWSRRSSYRARVHTAYWGMRAMSCAAHFSRSKLLCSSRLSLRKTKRLKSPRKVPLRSKSTHISRIQAGRTQWRSTSLEPWALKVAVSCAFFGLARLADHSGFICSGWKSFFNGRRCYVWSFWPSFGRESRSQSPFAKKWLIPWLRCRGLMQILCLQYLCFGG